LSESLLNGADLTDADLRWANLIRTNLNQARLDGTDMSKAKYSKETKWPEGFDPIAAGAILE
jgi:uncharacterized protein YjbI with pentapeptide repeats